MLVGRNRPLENFLEAAFKQLDERDSRLLREILFEDGPPATREEADALLDALRIGVVKRELREVEEFIGTPEAAVYLPVLLAYARGLRRLLDPKLALLRRLFCEWKAERERRPE